MRSKPMLAALAAGGAALSLTAGGAHAQMELDTWVEFQWQDTTQAACMARAEDSINSAIDRFDLDVATRFSDWNAIGLTDDLHFWIFCIADAGDGTVVNPDAQRLVVLSNVATSRLDLGLPLRDYLADCMSGECPAAPAEMASWADNALDYRGQEGLLVDYQCPPLGNEEIGVIWGTDIYTDDSSVCGAGVHAGVITTEGGWVTIEILPSRKAYRGSTQNGITTYDSESYDGSFEVVDPAG